MNTRPGLLATLALATALILSACGGAASGGDPVAVVKDLYSAIESKQFARIADMACAANRDEVEQTFNFGESMAGALGGGIDPQKVIDAMSFSTSGMEYTEVSRSGDKAVVHVKGTLKISVDAAKFKDIVAELLKAQGLTDVDPSLLDQSTNAIVQQFDDFGQEFDDDINVVNENGKWVICR